MEFFFLRNRWRWILGVGGVRTVASADGGVRLGDRPRDLQQRAAGVEQQPTVRRRPPAGPSARCHQTPRHARAGNSGTACREWDRWGPPEERRRGGRHLQEASVRRRVSGRHEVARRRRSANLKAQVGARGGVGVFWSGRCRKQSSEGGRGERIAGPNPKPPLPPPLAAAACWPCLLLLSLAA